MAFSFEADPVLKAQNERETEPFREAVKKPNGWSASGYVLFRAGR